MDFVSRIKEALANKETISRVFEVVKQVGIYESLKAIMKNPMFRDAIRAKLLEMGDLAVKKYGITSVRYRAENSENRYAIVAEIEIPDENARKEFMERLNETVKNLYDPKFSIVAHFHKEFEIGKISCKERDGRVFVRIEGNEKLKELLEELGGVVVEEGGEEGGKE